MAVNMAYVPKPKSGNKVLKMTPPWNGSADIALTSEKLKRRLSEVLIVFRIVKNLCKYNILQENDYSSPQLLIMHKITNIHGRNYISLFPKKNYDGMKNYA
jgi:hypothetical protein